MLFLFSIARFSYLVRARQVYKFTGILCFWFFFSSPFSWMCVYFVGLFDSSWMYDLITLPSHSFNKQTNTKKKIHTERNNNHYMVSSKQKNKLYIYTLSSLAFENSFILCFMTRNCISLLSLKNKWIFLLLFFSFHYFNSRNLVDLDDIHFRRNCHSIDDFVNVMVQLFTFNLVKWLLSTCTFWWQINSCFSNHFNLMNLCKFMLFENLQCISLNKIRFWIYFNTWIIDYYHFCG